MVTGASLETKAPTTISGAALTRTIKSVTGSSQSSGTNKSDDTKDSKAEIGQDQDGNNTETQTPKTDAETKVSNKKIKEILALKDSIPGGRKIPDGKDLVDVMKQNPGQFKGIDDQPKSSGSSSASPDPSAQANAGAVPGIGGAGGGAGGGSGGGWSGAGAQPHSHGGGYNGGINPGTGPINNPGTGPHHASPEVFTDVAKYQQHFKEEGGTVKFNDQKVTINGQEFYTGIHTTGNNQEHPILASVNVVDPARSATSDTINHQLSDQPDQLTASMDTSNNQAAVEAVKPEPPPPPPPEPMSDRSQGTQTA